MALSSRNARGSRNSLNLSQEKKTLDRADETEKRTCVPFTSDRTWHGTRVLGFEPPCQDLSAFVV